LALLLGLGSVADLTNRFLLTMSERSQAATIDVLAKEIGSADAAGSFPVRCSCLGLARTLSLASLRWMGTENLPFSFPIAGLDRALELTAGVNRGYEGNEQCFPTAKNK
jgi:hypothetical protein